MLTLVFCPLPNTQCMHVEHFITSKLHADNTSTDQSKASLPVLEEKASAVVAALQIHKAQVPAEAGHSMELAVAAAEERA